MSFRVTTKRIHAGACHIRATSLPRAAPVRTGHDNDDEIRPIPIGAR
jgi:hypothetical protein